MSGDPTKRVIYLKPGDTEPLEITVSATGLSNLDNIAGTNGVLVYARLRGAATNHVDGGDGTVSDSATKKVSFDPTAQAVGGGNAFAAAGTYEVYVKLTFSDGDEIRFPGKNEENLRVVVDEDWES